MNTFEPRTLLNPEVVVTFNMGKRLQIKGEDADIENYFHL